MKKVYCKLTGVKYQKTDLNISKMLSVLIFLFLESPNTPIDIFQNSDCTKICMKKAKKFICREVNKYVKNSKIFNNNFKAEFKLTPKQVSQLLKRRSNKISIFIVVLIYFLVERILVENGLGKLLNKNQELGLILNVESGLYFMQKTYIYLVNIIKTEEAEPDNRTLLLANYIIDCFHRIDKATINVQNWYNNYNKVNVDFAHPPIL